ncbi:MAG: 50S ribosomal protein L6 [Kiritimatiellae bacterium]|jgi:large subunit ribosomal protein L6|nr:50S ribosomal protein L6 [Kiritimatiellia bacterium]MBR4190980.1 50S ribosomal protein L6 [Kiritimatiellia bacterium]
MSRIGKQPVAVPAGVEFKLDGGTATLKGPKGQLSIPVPACIQVKLEDGKLTVSRAADDKFSRAMHGTVRAHLANMVEGVTKGFSRELEIQGVGYRASISGKNLNLLLGLSHPVDYPVPEGVTVTVADGVNLKVEGIDKQLVGEVAARIRSFRPPEPYKGKGVRYKDEHVRRKAGKTVS